MGVNGSLKNGVGKWEIRNKTSRRVILEGRDNSLVIPAYGKKRVTGAFLKDISSLDQWVAWGLVEIGRFNNDRSAAAGGSYAVGCAALIGLLAVAVAISGTVPPDLRESVAFRTSLAGAAIIATILLAVGWLSGRWQGLSRTMEKLASYLSILLFLLVGLGLPAFLIYHFSEIGESARSAGIDGALLGRGLQFAFIAIASMLPALLYFLFDRQRLEKVRRDFYREVMRLDPDIQTLADAETKYGEMVEEVYGSSQASSFLLGAGCPILISTLLIILGWTWTLLPLGQTVQAADGPLLDVLFKPAPNALIFGFLGAYFFALNVVFRGYIRADLTPKTYAHITLRLLMTSVFVWVLSLLPAFSGTAGEWQLPVIAFLVGIVPETGLALLQDSVNRSWMSQVVLQRVFPSLREEHPLTVLEGINLYDRARLLEEGIENVENLAHAELIELMLRTRIPPSRLVDLFDQAILYLHVHGIKDGREKLRKLGIRTATDLEKVCEGLKGEEHERFLRVLDDPAESSPVSPLKSVMQALKDDEWMAHLRNWRSCSQVAAETYTLDDFARDVGADAANVPEGAAPEVDAAGGPDGDVVPVPAM